GSGGDREGERERTADEVPRPGRRHQNRGIPVAPGRAWRVPADWPGGARHEGGASPVRGFRMERGKAGADTVPAGAGPEGARQAAEAARRWVLSRRLLADRPVGAGGGRYGRGARGAG